MEFGDGVELQQRKRLCQLGIGGRGKRLLHDTLLADEREHGGQRGVEQLPEHPGRGVDGG